MTMTGCAMTDSEVVVIVSHLKVIREELTQQRNLLESHSVKIDTIQKVVDEIKGAQSRITNDIQDIRLKSELCEENLLQLGNTLDQVSEIVHRNGATTATDQTNDAVDFGSFLRESSVSNDADSRISHNGLEKNAAATAIVNMNKGSELNLHDFQSDHTSENDLNNAEALPVKTEEPDFEVDITGMPVVNFGPAQYVTNRGSGPESIMFYVKAGEHRGCQLTFWKKAKVSDNLVNFSCGPCYKLKKEKPEQYTGMVPVIRVYNHVIIDNPENPPHPHFCWGYVNKTCVLPEDTQSFGAAEYVSNKQKKQRSIIYACKSERSRGKQLFFWFKNRFIADKNTVNYLCSGCYKLKKQSPHLYPGLIPVIRVRNDIFIDDPEYPSRPHYCISNDVMAVQEVSSVKEVQEDVINYGLAEFIVSKRGGENLVYHCKSEALRGTDLIFWMKNRLFSERNTINYQCAACCKLKSKYTSVYGKAPVVRVRDGVIIDDPENPPNPHFCFDQTGGTDEDYSQQNESIYGLANVTPSAPMDDDPMEVHTSLWQHAGLQSLDLKNEGMQDNDSMSDNVRAHLDSASNPYATSTNDH